MFHVLFLTYFGHRHNSGYVGEAGLAALNNGGGVILPAHDLVCSTLLPVPLRFLPDYIRTHDIRMTVYVHRSSAQADRTYSSTRTGRCISCIVRFLRSPLPTSFVFVLSNLTNLLPIYSRLQSWNRPNASRTFSPHSSLGLV
jgi:hypothetical protein